MRASGEPSAGYWRIFTDLGVQDDLEALRKSDNGIRTLNRHIKKVKTSYDITKVILC